MLEKKKRSIDVTVTWWMVHNAVDSKIVGISPWLQARLQYLAFVDEIHKSGTEKPGSSTWLLWKKDANQGPGKRNS